MEQGGVLENREHVIGVVEGIVGQRRFTIEVGGVASHAGTTPMDLRQDALVAASQVVLAVNELALRHPGDPVATVGKLETWPNAANVVPGRVVMSVDMRDLDVDVLDSLVLELRSRVQTMASTSGVPSAWNPSSRWSRPLPTPA